MNVFSFSSPAKRTNNANNGNHYVKLFKKRRESSKRNNYIISFGAITKAIIIILSVFCLFLQQKQSSSSCLYSVYFWQGLKCMWVYVCIYARTHTHLMYFTRMWAQGSGLETWRTRRICHGMDWISAYMYSYMCTKYNFFHICWATWFYWLYLL